MTQTYSVSGKNRKKNNQSRNRTIPPGMGTRGRQHSAENQVLGFETYSRIAKLRYSIQEVFNQQDSCQKITTQLLNLKVEDNERHHICEFVLSFCAEGRKYPVYYSRIVHKLISLDEVHKRNFEDSFMHYYSFVSKCRGIVGEDDVNKIRNVAKYFGLLLSYDAISWSVFSCVQLTKMDLTVPVYEFLKVVFEVISSLDISLLKQRFDDATMYHEFRGIFPTDTPQNTEIAIDFYESVNLSQLADKLRRYLAKRKYVVQRVRVLKLRNLGSSSSSDSEDDFFDDGNTGKNIRSKGKGNIQISNS